MFHIKGGKNKMAQRRKKFIVRRLNESTAHQYSQRQLDEKRKINHEKVWALKEQIERMKYKLVLLEDRLSRLPDNPRSREIKEEVRKLLDQTTLELKALRARYQIAHENFTITEQVWLDRVSPRISRI
jgi:hypothetical protein